MTTTPLLLSWIAIGLLSAGVTAAATRWLIPFLKGRGVMDVPNARSSHEVPTPRGGGIAILAGIAAAGVAASLGGLPLPGWGFWVGAAVIAAVGGVDDRVGGLPASLRFGLQVAAAVVGVVGTGGLTAFPLPAPLDVSLGVLAWPVAVFWIVAVTNIYNFLDGIDGYAASQGVIAGGAMLALAVAVPALGIAAGVAGACLGFLVFNWHPARIFMGDVGSATLGFALSVLPFHASSAAAPGVVLVVALALWFFLADGAFTLVRRALRGEKVWEAHRSHLYQRLVQSGLRHDQVVLRVCALSLPVATAGVAAWYSGSAEAGWGVVSAGVLAFAIYVGYTIAREHANALATDVQAGSQ